MIWYTLIPPAGYNVRPVMEVEVVKGRDLVPKDSNGLSDPYVVIKYGSHVMFRSSVIKKTLNPHWEESATLTAPGTDDVIHVVGVASGSVILIN